MGRTERRPVTIANSSSSAGAVGGGYSSGGGGYMQARSDSLPLPNGMVEPPPNFFGRPTDSIMERIFPWHKLLSFSTFICIVNTIMFIATLIVGGVKFDGAFVSNNNMGGPSTYTLRFMGGKWEPWIVQGEVWRLITPIFLHSGLLHLVSNVFFQLRFGWVLEARWGIPRTVLIYLVAGIAASAMSCFCAPGVVSVGASGALFGILAADITYLALNWNAILNNTGEALMLGIIVVLNIIFGFTGSGVDNYAHLGGIIFGLLLGGWVPEPVTKRPQEKPIRIAFLTVTVILFILYIALIWIVHGK